MKLTPITQFNSVGIDCETKGKNEIVRRLKSLASTKNVNDLGAYREAPECSALHVTTSKTMDEVEDWLYKNNLDYLGVFDPEIHEDTSESFVVDSERAKTLSQEAKDEANAYLDGSGNWNQQRLGLGVHASAEGWIQHLQKRRVHRNLRLF